MHRGVAMLERKIYSELLEWKNKRISANIPGAKLVPGNTLIFLDEIQFVVMLVVDYMRMLLQNA